MRTTLTLDDDLAMALHREARDTGRPFKQIVNECLRRGLTRERENVEVDIPAPRSMGRPLMDLTQANALADSLDDERLLGQQP
jgi:hypothetical protein